MSLRKTDQILHVSNLKGIVRYGTYIVHRQFVLFLYYQTNSKINSANTYIQKQHAEFRAIHLY